MADDRGKKPGAPFVGDGDDEWESDLAAWDAAIPIATRAPAVPPPAVRPPAPDVTGGIPEEENPFFETPTTVVSPGQLLDLDDLPDVVPAGAFDDGGASASGSYAALITTDSSAPGLFDRDPLPEHPPVLPREMLPEMDPAAWSADLGGLIALGAGPVAAPEAGYWETLGQILEEERLEARAESHARGNERDRSVALGLAAARVAEALGRSEAALEILNSILFTDGGQVVAHRARLVLSERTGADGSDLAGESLARLALMPHGDQAYYRSLRV
ncbi:MAG: hypothetical protein ABUS79_26905, partial [Pseudomonadota bacterium]